MKPFAIYHEHPDRFKPLFAELKKRGIPYERLNPCKQQEQHLHTENTSM